MKYDKYSYLFPPRPENAIDPGSLEAIQKKRWWAQVKKEGQCSLIFVAPDRSIIVKNRHKADHKNWQPSAHTAATFKKLPGKGWYVFVGELLHAKGIGVKDTHYLFDIIVEDGHFLFGESFQDRIAILEGLFPITDTGTYDHYVIDDHTWLAKTFREPLLRDLFDATRLNGDEGIVAKDPNAGLNLCMRDGTNSPWQVKCRHGKSNLQF